MVLPASISLQRAGSSATGGMTAPPPGNLSNLKESHPIQAADFAIQLGVALEPGFNWWVFCVFKKRDAIISLVKCCNIRFLKTTHKYNLPLPKLFDNALAIDKGSGSTLWADAIDKKIKNSELHYMLWMMAGMSQMDSSLSHAT